MGHGYHSAPVEDSFWESVFFFHFVGSGGPTRVVSPVLERRHHRPANHFLYMSINTSMNILVWVALCYSATMDNSLFYRCKHSSIIFLG